MQALEQRGAEVFPVPIYEWALPEDLSQIRHALDEVIAGRVNVILITNAAQVDHVMQMLEQDGKVEPFRAALRKMVVASIGPTASERLRHYGWPVDFEPSHPKMGTLVKETSEVTFPRFQRHLYKEVQDEIGGQDAPQDPTAIHG